MAASDATPFPIKNQAYRVTFPILDADGDLVTGATGLDSETSADGGTFADCTNEATEIATASGVYYLDLTAGEMNADTVAVIVKTSTSGAKTTTLILYPITNGLDIPVNVTYFGGSAGTFSGGRPEVNTTHAAGTAWGSGAITDGSIAADAITAAKVAADVTTELQSGLATAASISTLQTSVNDLPTNAELATALDSADDVVVAGLITIEGKVDGIKAKTDSLTFTKALELDVNLQSVNGVTVNGDGAGTPMGA